MEAKSERPIVNVRPDAATATNTGIADVDNCNERVSGSERKPSERLAADEESRRENSVVCIVVFEVWVLNDKLSVMLGLGFIVKVKRDRLGVVAVGGQGYRKCTYLATEIHGVGSLSPLGGHQLRFATGLSSP
ncbi:unnamed protein product [Bursaphelenchus xylophilus]|uniref:(pine wood nematode) hypothetical protein n=1 Tax=Bursaphelenchus xylophilus TaxID=6326 RepID=A0A1I7RIT1_BURXY|nr:unnamed protein product [Bursaphelenchus xylophilus]CAG9119072.1 unnamed protein product [Bursaphelenchus xylophilus]